MTQATSQDFEAILKTLIDQATVVCASEGCANRWEHTHLCNEMWRAVASMKARAA